VTSRLTGMWTDRLKNRAKPANPKTYARLNAGTERCIYDAFTCVQGVNDSGAVMGLAVNA
jgi:hypothetical protein